MISLALLSALALADAPALLTYSGRENQLKVPIPRLEETIEVDGRLDDPAWSRAARLTDFSQYSPNDGRPAEQKTEILIFYSASAVHFGVRAEAPLGTVRASLAQRDKLTAEDSITFLLSTFNDGRQAVSLTVNPLGVQQDGTLIEGLSAAATRGGFSGMATGREAPDLAPDFVFQSKGRLTEAGYEIELRLPFKSLRYQKAEIQSWGLHVLRKSQSSGYEDSWAPARRDATSFLAQGGVIEGMRELRPGLVLDLNPEFTGRVDGAPATQGGWQYDGQRPEIGGNVRWGVTPNLSLNGTINPDFSQVEADASQIQYDPRNALFFDEKRPFFLDGLEQFATPNRLIYTRRISAPVTAAKLTGTLSGTSVGFLSAIDDSTTSRTGDTHPIFNLLRARRDIGKRSRLGLVYTDKIDGDDYNRVLGLDGRIAIGDISSLDLQAAFSANRRPGRSTRAPLFQAIFNRNGKKLGTRALITGIDDDFVAGAGFISRPGIVHAALDQRISFFGSKGSVLEAWNTDVVLDGTWRYDAFFGEGGVQDKKLHVNNNATWRGGWKTGASILIESFGYDQDLYSGYVLEGDRPGSFLPFVGVPRLANLDWVLSLTTPEFKHFSGYFNAVWGKDENFYEWSSGNIAYVTAQLDWRPTEKLRLNATYNLQNVVRRSDGSLVARRQIPRLKLEYQATRAIFGRVIAQYDAQYQDALRDDTRTERPVYFFDSASGDYAKSAKERSNGVRLDALFAWQPTPGTVFFAGYGSSLSERDTFAFKDLSRSRDGFFVKFSYLFRL
ncbi:MAG: carbohydrate binding family 9 domain-containing protein [Vicinamibacteria bacterium]|nr:carbohydrate binding family 9 domain-containing protein [Vicinamibacteria bacterium]